jgi:hypothetical protein
MSTIMHDFFLPEDDHQHLRGDKQSPQKGQCHEEEHYLDIYV